MNVSITGESLRFRICSVGFALQGLGFRVRVRVRVRAYGYIARSFAGSP